MGRKKKKPGYDANKIMTEFFSAVSECYTNEDLEKRSIRKVADEFGITHLKVRKILITTGVYSTDASNEVKERIKWGRSQQVKKIEWHCDSHISL